MRNRFNLNESEKNRIRGLHGIVNEQFQKTEIWPFSMSERDFQNRIPGGTGLPEECDKCLMATIPEQYLDSDKRFGVFKTIVKLIVQTTGLSLYRTSSDVSTWEKPIIKLSEIIDVLKDFSPLDMFDIAKDLFKCMKNECSPKKILPHQIMQKKWDVHHDQTGKVVIINGLKFVLDKDGKIMGQKKDNRVKPFNLIDDNEEIYDIISYGVPTTE